MKASKQDILVLATLIQEEIRKEFESKKLSGNLARTINISETADGYQVEIPAEIYDMYKYFTHKVIVPTGEGSYAKELDKKGSSFTAYNDKGKTKKVRPGNHKGYVDKAVQNALKKWELMYSNKYKVKSKSESK